MIEKDIVIPGTSRRKPHNALHNFQFEHYATPPSEDPIGGGVNPQENRDNFVVVDELIQQFIQVSPEQQIEKWQSAEFATAFPHIVRRVLSAEGKTIFSLEDRKGLYYGSIHALSDFSKRAKEFTTKERTEMGMIKIYYDFANEQAIRRKVRENEINLEPLYDTNLGGIILLGMSIPDTNDDIALHEVLELYKNYQAINYPIKIKDAIGRLLLNKSNVRMWVEKHKLAEATGQPWDATIADLLLSFPENKIDIANLLPAKLPSEMTTTNAFEDYSQEAYEIFLDYAEVLVDAYTNITQNPNKKKIRTRVHTELIAFRANVLHFPREFWDNREVRTILKKISSITNLRLTEKEQKNEQGVIADARELLFRKKRRLRLKETYSDVQNLLS